MLKLNQDYSDYTDESDENYPEGKAINATSSESYDGTPLLAEFMNDINAAHIAMYKKAYGQTSGINGEPDTQKNSQFANAVVKYTDDKVKAHEDKRGLANGVHGATAEASAGQLVSRDEYGRAKFGAPVDDSDVARKAEVDAAVKHTDDEVNELNERIDGVEDSLGTASTKDVGSAEGNVPVVADGFTSTENGLVGVGTNGALKNEGITVSGVIGVGNAGVICQTASATQAKSVELPGFALYAGVTVKVMFKNGNSANNPTLNINNTGAKAIKVVYAGSKIVPVNHTGYWRGAPVTSVEMWQPYTILELMYDGTDWVICGNPTVESWASSDGDKSYEVKADGSIEQTLHYKHNKTSDSISYTWTYPVVFSVIAIPIAVCWRNLDTGDGSCRLLVYSSESKSSCHIRGYYNNFDGFKAVVKGR